jgi:hypothetical protein
LVAVQSVEPRVQRRDEVITGDDDLRPRESNRLADGVGVVLVLAEALTRVGQVVEARFEGSHPLVELVLGRLRLVGRRIDGEREKVDRGGLGGVPCLEAAPVDDVRAQHRGVGPELGEGGVGRLGRRRHCPGEHPGERGRDEDGSAEHVIDGSGGYSVAGGPTRRDHERHGGRRQEPAWSSRIGWRRSTTSPSSNRWSSRRST